MIKIVVRVAAVPPCVYARVYACVYAEDQRNVEGIV